MATLWEAAPGLSDRDRKRGKRLACQSQPLGDCRIRVRLDGSEPAAALRPSGFRPACWRGDPSRPT